MGSSYSIPPEKNVVNVGDEISQQLIDALNAAPAPSSGNPYATAADISSAISAIPAALPLTGGTMTGAIDINSGNASTSSHTESAISFTNTGIASWLDAESLGINVNGNAIQLSPSQLWLSNSTSGNEIFVTPDGLQGVLSITFSDGSIQTTAGSGTQGPQGPAGTNGTNGTVWNYLGAYDGGITYAPNDYVTLDGSSYVMINFIGAAGYSPLGYPGSWQLVASKGDQGPQGPQGNDGPQGPQGNDGPQGSSGSNGNDGGSFSDASYDGTPYIRINQSWQPLSSYGIGEAPNNGSPYVRINNEWSPMSYYDQNSGGGGGGISDAPADNTYYIRVNSSWAPAFRDAQGNASGDPFYPFEVKITVNSTDYWMPIRPV